MLASWRFHFTCVPPAIYWIQHCLVLCTGIAYLQMQISLVPMIRYEFTCSIEVGNTKYRFTWFTEVPGPKPRINSCTDNRVTFSCVPVDVRDSTIVRREYMFDRCLADQEQVPDQAVTIISQILRQKIVGHTVSRLK